MRLALAFLLSVPLLGCVSNERIREVSGPTIPADASERRPEATSPLGRPLYAFAAGANPEAEANLAAARQQWDADPDNTDRTIWLGRRLGYLWRMNDAITVFTVGLEKSRNDVRLLRHRGHRFLSLRRFADARADLERAANLLQRSHDDVEPDGLPNAKNQPLTSTAFNVWYHLMLARYFQGDYAGAEKAWAASRVTDAAAYPDNQVATAYWGVLILKRLGYDGEAGALLKSVPERPELLENHAYFQLLRFFRGEIGESELRAAGETGSVDPATIGYGIGIWRKLSGEAAAAREAFERVLETGSWPAFGYIAAEVELTRNR